MKNNNRSEQGVTPIFTIIAGYIIAIALCIMFALYMSAEIGWTFAYILIAAPMFSLIVTLVLRFSHSISVSAECDKTMVYKGETLKLRVTVSNASIFPAPAVIVKLCRPTGFSVVSVSECTEKPFGNSYSVSVYQRNSTVFEICYRAEMWGGGRLGVESCKMQDFMRFFTFPLIKGDLKGEYSEIIKVIPNIPDVPSDMPLIRSVANDLQFCEDSEETKETEINTQFSGMPGYNHREYEEGDPIKRINWKLSTKKNSYMIRLDDEVEAVQQNIMLSPVGAEPYENERAVEGLLAVVFSLYRLGFKSAVFFRTGDGYISSEISDYGDVTELQTKLASYSFLPSGVHLNSALVPDELKTSRGGGVLLCTPEVSKQLAAAVGAETAAGLNVTVISASRALSGTVNSLWLLGEDYSAEQFTN